MMILLTISLFTLTNKYTTKLRRREKKENTHVMNSILFIYEKWNESNV